MRWIAQMAHVTAKDVRHARWSLAAYVAMLSVTAVSFATGRALGPYWTSSSTETLGMMNTFAVILPDIIVVFGFILTASLLQADSPTKAAAFWASRPLAPSALLASKVVSTSVAIVALPLLGALAVLKSFDASGPAVAAMLAPAALSYGELLIAAMIVGALTDDIRAFGSVYLAILVATVIVLETVDELRSHPVEYMPFRLTLISCVGGVALLAFMYRARDRRLGAWIAGVAVVMSLVVASFNTPSVGHAATPTLSTGPRLEIEPIDPNSWAVSRRLQMRVRAASVPDSERLDFDRDTIRFETREGSSIHDDTRWSPSQLVGGGLPPVGQPVHWIIDSPAAEWPGIIIHEPSDDVQRHLSQGVKSVMVGGGVTVSRARVVASLPLREGASVTRDGRRLSIYGVAHGQTNAQVWLHLSVIPRAASVPEPNLQLRRKDGLQFAIVNDARSEAMLLEQPDSVNGGSGGSGSIVLPWVNVSTTFMRLDTKPLPQATDNFPRDNAWYTDARLVVIEWTVTGYYRTRAEATLP